MQQVRYIVFAALVFTLGPGVIHCGEDEPAGAAGGASSSMQPGSSPGPGNTAPGGPGEQVDAGLSGSADHQCGDGSATPIQPASPNGAAVNVVVVGSQNPIVAGQAVTFTVAVAPAVSSLIFPTGKVTLSIDDSPRASAVLDHGCARFTVSSLATGSHAVVANYDGDANYAGKLSRPYIESVNQAFTKPWQSGIDVTTRGLVGDGVTDNTAAMQALIASIGTDRVKLYFPAGTYMVSDTINLNAVGNISFGGDVDQNGNPASTIKADHIATPYNATPSFFANGPPFAFYPLIVRDSDSIARNPDGSVNLDATMPGGSPLHMKNLRLIAPDAPNSVAFFGAGFGNSALENMEVSGYFGVVTWNDIFFLQFRNVKFVGHGIPGSVGLVAGQGVVDQCGFSGWSEGMRNISASVVRSTFENNGYGMRIGISAYVGTSHADERWQGMSGILSLSRLDFKDNDVGIDGGGGAIYYSDINIAGSAHSFSGQSKRALNVAGGNVAYNNINISGSFSEAPLGGSSTSGSMYGLQVSNATPDVPTWDILGRIFYSGGGVPSNPQACPTGSTCRFKDMAYAVPLACDSGTMQVASATYYNADGSTSDCTAQVAQACNGQPNCTVNIDRSSCGSTYAGPGELDWQGLGTPEYGITTVSCSGTASNPPLPNAAPFHVYSYAMPNAIADQDNVIASSTVPSAEPTIADVSMLLDVTKHGIDPNDWSLDQTTKIQDLIDTAPNGTTFYFPQGAYNFSKLDFSRLTSFSVRGDGNDGGDARGVSTLNGGIVANYGTGAGSFQIRDIDVWGGIFASNAVLSNIQNVQVGPEIVLSNPFMVSIRGLAADSGYSNNPGSMVTIDGGMRATVEAMNLGGTWDGIRMSGANHAVFSTRCEVAHHGGINLGVDAKGAPAPLINASIAGVQGEADVIGVNAVNCDHCMVSSFFTLGHSLRAAAADGTDIPNPYGVYVDNATNSTFAAVGAGGYFFTSSIAITGAAKNDLFTAVDGWNGTGPVWTIDPAASGLIFNDSTNP